MGGHGRANSSPRSTRPDRGGMFARRGRGPRRAARRRRALRVPAGHRARRRRASESWLVLEWLELGAARRRERGAARRTALAAQHRAAAAEVRLGARQLHRLRARRPTAGANDWLAFWRERRLVPQLRMAAQQPTALADDRPRRAAGGRLRGVLPHLCTRERSLLHGDLWGGNAAAIAGVHAGGIRSRGVRGRPRGRRRDDRALRRVSRRISSRPTGHAWPLDDGYTVRRRLLQPVPRAQPREPLRRRLCRTGSEHAIERLLAEIA